jgi:hypothetical protein
MAAADYIPLVQSLYISYFGRPADTLGLANFTAQLEALHAPKTVNELTAAYAKTPALKTLIDSFGSSAESAALYTGDNVAFVTAIYNNVLNRAPDFDGLVYWASKINSGELTKANASLAIMAGAVNNTSAQGLVDAAVVAAKVSIATAFTTAIDTGAELAGYSGAAAAASARDMLKTVTSTDTAASFAATIDATLVKIVDGSIPTTTVALTAGVDTLVGTSGNNIITGNDSTYTGLDSIDGGLGNDKLVLSDVAGGGLDLSDATVKNVEVLELTSTGAMGNDEADLTEWTGLTSATISTKTNNGQTVLTSDSVDISFRNKGNADVTIEGGKNVIVETEAGIVSVTGNGGLASVTVTGGTTVAIDDDGEGSLTTVSLTEYAALATIAADKLTSLSLSDSAQGVTVTAAAGTRALALNLNEVTGVAAITDATATSVAVTSTGAASSIALNAAAATAVTLAGDVKLTMALTGAAVTSITSTSTGAVTLSNALGNGVAYTGAAGVDTISVGATTKAIKTGAGNDVVTVGANALGTGGSIDAGDGTGDVLSMTALNAATASAGTTFAAAISNFEKLNLSAVVASSTNTVDLANLDNINYVQIAGAAAGTASNPGTGESTQVTVTGTASDADTVTFDGTLIQLADGDTDAQAAAKIAAGSYANYTVTAAGAVLTVVNKAVGNAVDLTAPAFTFADGLATGAPAAPGVAVTVQGVTGVAAVAAASEVQTMTIAGTATGPVAFLGVDVAGTNIGSDVDTVGAAIVLDKVNIMNAWNTANPARELLDITYTAGTDTLTLTYKITEGNVAPMSGAVSNGIGFGNASTTSDGNLATTLVTAVAEQFTATFTTPANGADIVTFDGTPIALADGDTAAIIAGKVAAGVYANWTAVAAGAVVTFTNKATGTKTDAVSGDFAITDTTTGTGTQAVVIGAITSGTAATVGTAGALILSNLASAGTLEINGAGTYTVNVKDAAAGTADVLNLVQKAAAGFDAGVVTAANVETVNITTTDNETSTGTANADLMTLVATSAKTITVTGNGGLNLTNTGNVKVTSFDASGVTLFGTGTTAAKEAAAAVTFTSVNTTSTASVSIKGGAGADVLTGSIATDTIVGGSGADMIDGKGGVNTLTGGAGNDTFTFSVLADSAVKASTITDLAAGDKIVLVNNIVDTDLKMGAAVTGLDATTAVFQDWVDAGVSAVAVGGVSWFQYQNNTYIVQDLGADSTTFANGVDNIVKITGNVDLSASTIVLVGGTITIV